MVSHYGTKLFHDSYVKSAEKDSPTKNQQRGKTFAFAPSNRFFYYKYQEKRMPPNLGPGSYDPQESFKKLTSSPCQVVVKPLLNHKLDSSCGKTYYLDGGLITKDPHADKIYGKPLSDVGSVRDCKSERWMRRRNIRTQSLVASPLLGGSDLESTLQNPGRYLLSARGQEIEYP